MPQKEQKAQKEGLRVTKKKKNPRTPQHFWVVNALMSNWTPLSSPSSYELLAGKQARWDAWYFLIWPYRGAVRTQARASTSRERLDMPALLRWGTLGPWWRSPWEFRCRFAAMDAGFFVQWAIWHFCIKTSSSNALTRWNRAVVCYR